MVTEPATPAPEAPSPAPAATPAETPAVTTPASEAPKVPEAPTLTQPEPAKAPQPSEFDQYYASQGGKEAVHKQLMEALGMSSLSTFDDAAIRTLHMKYRGNNLPEPPKGTPKAPADAPKAEAPAAPQHAPATAMTQNQLWLSYAMEKAVSGTSLDPVGTLKEMNSLGVQVVNADGSVNVDRINNYVQMKVASAPKATTPEAAPATPTLPISPIDQPNPTMANPSAPASTGDTIADINAAGGIWGVYKNATAPKKGTK